MASITSSNHHLQVSKRHLKPLLLQDYLLDDFSSCSSNGFKSFPRILNSDIKRSRRLHHNPRVTCGPSFSHAIHKASTALLTAVKLLPSVKSPSPKRNNKKGIFSRYFWKIKPSRHELNVDGTQEMKQWRSFADFLKESQNQPSDKISYVSGEVTLSRETVGDSLSISKENSEVTQSSGEVIVMRSGDCVGSDVSDGSSLNDNTKECVNEEKEQHSPISILECPFEDDAISLSSHHNETDEKIHMRKSRRFETLVGLEPVELEKRIEQYVEREDCNSHITKTEEDESEIRANRLFALMKSRINEEKNHLLASHVVDNLILDFFIENESNETVKEDKLVEIVEEWAIRRREDEYNMFMSWEVRENREIYLKEMKWGCINEDEREYVVEELGNGFVTSLIHELILDLSL